MNRQNCGNLRLRNKNWIHLGLVAATVWWVPSITCLAVAETTSEQARAIAPVVETIRERFPDGRLKTEREVTTDSAGNYVNHGAWRMWDIGGDLVAEGRYEMARRTGHWMRRFDRDGAAVLSTVPFDQFDAPFVAKATFHADQLDGEWTIADAQDRKCSRVVLKYGKRNGLSTIWLPNGEVYREAAFRNGSPVGELRERGGDGLLQTTATYVGGQQLLNKVINFPESQIKQTEATCLVATVTEIAVDDFWDLRFAEYRAEDQQLRHGNWKCWYSNGQLQAEGNFQYDRESDTFTWWHANGQEAVKGDFVDGQPNGYWTWWHANGQKATVGWYTHGRQVGVWRRWAEDGRLVQQTEPKAASLADSNSGVPTNLTQQPLGR